MNKLFQIALFVLISSHFVRAQPTVECDSWQLSFFYFILVDCETGRNYLDKFKKVTEKEFWKEDQIILITKRCNDYTTVNGVLLANGPAPHVYHHSINLAKNP